jgi:hypothetical protein
MNDMNNKSGKTGLVIFCSLVILLNIMGCANTHSEVIPGNNREVAALNAEDIARIMLRAGFSYELIMELGTDLRNELLLSGAAQINVQKNAEALFAVKGNYIYVSSRSKGSFIYDFQKKESF